MVYHQFLNTYSLFRSSIKEWFAPYRNPRKIYGSREANTPPVVCRMLVYCTNQVFVRHDYKHNTTQVLILVINLTVKVPRNHINTGVFTDQYVIITQKPYQYWGFYWSVCYNHTETIPILRFYWSVCYNHPETIPILRFLLISML